MSKQTWTYVLYAYRHYLCAQDVQGGTHQQVSADKAAHLQHTHHLKAFA